MQQAMPSDEKTEGGGTNLFAGLGNLQAPSETEAERQVLAGLPKPRPPSRFLLIVGSFADLIPMRV